MKHKILLLSFLFSVLYCFAQVEYTDEVYPFDGSEPILNCKIKKLENENYVTYEYQNKIKRVFARAIRKDGKYIVLKNPEEVIQSNKQVKSESFRYQNKSYAHYERLYKKAQKQKKIGMASAVVGVGLVGIGIITFDNNPQVNPGTQDLPIIMMVGGTLLAGYGVPSYFFGKKKEKQNLEILEKFPEHQTKIGVAVTNNGVGVVLQF
jgi:hypothetical protein